MINNFDKRSETKSETKTLKPKTFAAAIDAATVSTVVFLFAAVLLLYLTNISVNMNMGWKEFGYETVILYIFTVTINFLTRSIAKRKGKEVKAHVAAFDEVTRLEQEIIEKGFRGLESVYCRRWEEQELKYARKRLLSSAGVDVEKFEEVYLKFSKKELMVRREELGLTEFQLKTVFKAKKIKRLHYEESYLSANLKEGRRASPTGGMNTVKFERIRTLQYLITAFAGVSVSASIVLDIIAEPSFGTVVMCIIKLVTILISAIAGMIGGYRLTAEMQTQELVRKAAEQQNFIKWCEKNEE
jgi:hypothetical protein